MQSTPFLAPFHIIANRLSTTRCRLLGRFLLRPKHSPTSSFRLGQIKYYVHNNKARAYCIIDVRFMFYQCKGVQLECTSRHITYSNMVGCLYVTRKKMVLQMTMDAFLGVQEINASQPNRSRTNISIKWRKKKRKTVCWYSIISNGNCTVILIAPTTYIAVGCGMRNAPYKTEMANIFRLINSDRKCCRHLHFDEIKLKFSILSWSGKWNLNWEVFSETRKYEQFFGVSWSICWQFKPNRLMLWPSEETWKTWKNHSVILDCLELYSRFF